MSRRGRGLVFVLLALACAGAATLWITAQDRTLPPADGELASSSPASQPEAAPAAATAETPVQEPLPPETQALAQRLAELERLAAAGHPEASCQLVVERLRCGFLQRWRPGPGSHSRELRLEAEGQLEEANQAAEATLLRIAQKKACGTAPPIESIDSLALLGPAAAAGHAPSAVLYFELGHEFRNERGIFMHPHFDAWRRDAARRLQAAFQAGHPGAARALGRAYLDDGDFANGLVPDDPRQAYLHLQLAAELSGGRRRVSDNLVPGLDSGERNRLKAEAARLHRERFGGRTYDGPVLLASGPYRQPQLNASDFCSLPEPL